MDYTVALDTDESVQELQFAAGARGIPHAFIIDTNGLVVFSGHPLDAGFMGKLEEALAQWVPCKVTVDREALLLMTVKELKGILAQHRVSTAGCVYKEDLVQCILDTCA